MKIDFIRLYFYSTIYNIYFGSLPYNMNVAHKCLFYIYNTDDIKSYY